MGYPHVIDISLPDNNKVNQVPLLGSLMHLGCLVLVTLAEDSVGDAQHVLGTFAKWEQTIAVQVSHTMRA